MYDLHYKTWSWSLILEKVVERGADKPALII